MQNKYQKFIIFFIVGVICLTSSFYNNNWSVVEPSYYRFWERNYERVVFARLAQSRQHGMFSAGGLLGLADLKDGKWDFNVDRQYDIYLTGEKFENYSAYKSHPGFQEGFVVSIFDLLTDFTPAQNGPTWARGDRGQSGQTPRRTLAWGREVVHGRLRKPLA